MKRTIYIIIALICMIGAIYCYSKVFRATYAPDASKSEAYAPTETETGSETEAETVQTDSESETKETEAAYNSPIDFDGLAQVNPDIYAWLKIENTNIDFPVVQSEVNDQFYLDHNSDGEFSANGAIFSEHVYNTKTFEDPVTLLYGHHMHDGAMMGRMQEYYTDAEFFENNPTFTIYMPDAEYEYGVFAAVPYPGDHILYYHDFTDEQAFTGFFDEIMGIRDLSANFREEYAPKPGDKVVILSTCLIADNHNRFLVMGKQLSEEERTQ